MNRKFLRVMSLLLVVLLSFTLLPSQVMAATAEEAGETFNDITDELTEAFNAEKAAEEAEDESETESSAEDGESVEILSEEGGTAQKELYYSSAVASDFSWSVSGTTLTISGNGSMPDYSSGSDTPWYSQKTDIWNIVISEGITRIGNHAFAEIGRLDTVTFPSTLTTIGSYAFADDSDTQGDALVLPENVTLLESRAFYYASYTKITLNYGLTQINSYCFQNSSITELDIPDSVTTIGEGCCYSCGSLVTAKLPADLSALPKNCFSGCTALESVVMPAKYYYNFPVGVFYKCSKLSINLVNDWYYQINYNNFSNSSITFIGTESQASSLLGTCGATPTAYVTPQTLTSTSKWAYTNDGSLYIYGSGAMPDYSSASDRPWNSYASSIKTVYVQGLTNIGKNAFNGFTACTRFQISESVTSIADYAFYNCDGLTSYTIPKGVKTIGSNAFYSCSALKSIKITSSVTSIGDSAFRDSDALTSVVIPDNVTYIGTGTFYSCGALKSITFGKGITAIRYGCCGECYNLTTVNFNGAVTWIAGEAFVFDNSLTGVVIPYTVTQIDQSAFRKSSTSTNTSPVYVYGNIKSVGSAAFQMSYVTVYGTENMWKQVSGYSGVNAKSITYAGSTGDFNSNSGWIFDGTRFIVTGTGATADYEENSYRAYNSIASSVKEIHIANGITTLGKRLFDSFTNCTVYDIPSTVTEYKDLVFGSNKAMTSFTMSDNVTAMGKQCFGTCSAMTSFTFSKNITAIPDQCFESCTALTSFNVPEGITSIGTKAFQSCSKIASVSLPASLTSIGSYAFLKCTALTTATVPANVNSLDCGVFENCTALKTVTFAGNKLSVINHSMFNGCKALTSVTIPDNVTKICENTFFNCTALTSVSLPDSLTAIGHDAFRICSNLESITIPANVSEIGILVFYLCSALKTVTFKGDKITRIYSGTFNGCTALETIDLPESVETLDANAFTECKNLTTVGGLSNLTTIGTSAFDGCTKLTSIGNTDNVTSIGDFAFYGCTNLVIENDLFGSGTALFPKATSLGYESFTGCDNLSDIYAMAPTDDIGEGKNYYRIMFSGICGENTVTDSNGNKTTNSIFWYFLKNGTLYITGEGDVTEATWMDNEKIYNGYKSDDANESCNALKHVVVSDGITSLPKNAFYTPSGLLKSEVTCDSLQRVVLGSSVNSIGEGAFYGAKNLCSIYFTGDKPTLCYNKILDSSLLNKTVFRIYYNQSSSGWSSYNRYDYTTENTSLLWVKATDSAISGHSYYTIEPFGTTMFAGDEKLDGTWYKVDAQGVVYTVNNTDKTASVVDYDGIGIKNNNLIIPAKIKIDNDSTYEEYQVVTISATAFTSDEAVDIESITVGSVSNNPKTYVTTVEAGAFGNAENLKWIYFTSATAPTAPASGLFVKSDTAVVIHKNNKSGWGTTFGGNTVYYASELDSSKKATDNSIYYSVYSNGTARVGASSASEEANDVSTYGDLSGQQAHTAHDDDYSATSVVIPDFVLYNNRMFMVNGFTRFAFYKSPVKSVTFGRFVGDDETEEDPAIRDCTFRQSSITTFALDSNNKNYLTINGALFGKGIDVEGCETSLPTRLIKAPAGLTSYTVPTTCTVIGDYAFAGETSLTSITLSNTKVIGSHAFYLTTALNTVTNSDVPYYLGDSAFESSGDFAYQTSSILYMGKNCFAYSGFKGISGTVNINTSIKYIGTLAFAHCENVKKFVLSGTNGNYAVINDVLYERNKNESTGENDGTLMLLQYPIGNETNTSFDMSAVSDKITAIAPDAFWGSSKLRKITMSDDTVTVGSRAFSNCRVLTEVNLGKSYYGEYDHDEDGLFTSEMFVDSPIEKITVSKKNVHFCNDSVGAVYSKDLKTLYYYPAANEASAYTVLKKTKVIAADAFRNNSSLYRVVIPNTRFESLGDGAFAYCPNLTEVYFGRKTFPETSTAVSGIFAGRTAAQIKNITAYFKASDEVLPTYFAGATVKTYSTIDALANTTDLSTTDYVFVLKDTSGAFVADAQVDLFVTEPVYDSTGKKTDDKTVYSNTFKTDSSGIISFASVDSFFNEGSSVTVNITKDDYLPVENYKVIMDEEMKISYLTITKQPEMFGVSIDGMDINTQTAEINLAEYTEETKTLDPTTKKETKSVKSKPIDIEALCVVDTNCTIDKMELRQGDTVLATDTSGKSNVTFTVNASDLVKEENLEVFATVTVTGTTQTVEVSTVLNVHLFYFYMDDDNVELDTSDIEADLSSGGSALSKLFGSASFDINLGDNVSIGTEIDGDGITLTLSAGASTDTPERTTAGFKMLYEKRAGTGERNTFPFIMSDEEGRVYCIRFAYNTYNFGYVYYKCTVLNTGLADFLDGNVDLTAIESGSFYGVVECSTSSKAMARISIVAKAALVYGAAHEFLDDNEIDDFLENGQYADVYSEHVKPKKVDANSNFSASLSGEFKFKYDKKTLLKFVEGTITGQLTFSFELSSQFMVWVVPVTFECEITLEGKIIIHAIMDDNNDLTFDQIRMQLGIEITASLGIGCKLCSAGVYGTVGMVFIFDFYPEMGIDSFTINAELGVYFKILWYRKEFPLLELEYKYEGKKKALNASLQNYMAGTGEVSTAYIAEDYEFTEDIDEKGKLFIMNGDIYKLGFANVYSGEGGKYDELNSTKLCIWKWNGTDWESPEILDDNGLADADYNLYTDSEGNLMLSYTQKTDKMNTNDTADIYSAVEDLSVKCADLSKGIDNISISTVNETSQYYKYLTGISYVNGVKTAVWVENSDNNVFGVSPLNYVDDDGNAHIFKTTANSIWYSTYNETTGKWSDAVCAKDGLSAVTSVSVTNSGKIVFLEDTDGDLSTNTDRSLQTIDTKSSNTCNTLTTADGSITNIRTVGNDIVCSVYVPEETESYTNGKEGDEPVEVVTKEAYGKFLIINADTQVKTDLTDISVLPDSFAYIPEDSTNTSSALFFKQSVVPSECDVKITDGSVPETEGGEAIYAKFCDIIDGEKVWGGIVKITTSEQGRYISSYDACRTSDGRYVVALTYVDSSGVTKSKETKFITPGANLTIKDYKIDYLASPQTVTVTVENTGTEKAKIYAFENGKSVSFTGNTEIAAGNTTDIVIAIDKNTTSFGISATETEAVSQSVTMTYADIKVKAKQVMIGDRNYLVVALSNIGNLAITDGVLTVGNAVNVSGISKNEEDNSATVEASGTQVLKEYTDIALQPGEMKYFQVLVDDDLITDDTSIVSVKATISAYEPTELKDNNIALIYGEDITQNYAEGASSKVGIAADPELSSYNGKLDLSLGDSDRFNAVTVLPGEGNTLEGVYCGDGKLTAGTDYTYNVNSNEFNFIFTGSSKFATAGTYYVDFRFVNTETSENVTLRYTLTVKDKYVAVTWVINGVSSVDYVTKGTVPVCSYNLDRTGYEFVGWDATKNDGNSTADYTSTALPTASKDTTYYAVYKEYVAPVKGSSVICTINAHILGDSAENSETKAYIYTGSGSDIGSTPTAVFTVKNTYRDKSFAISDLTSGTYTLRLEKTGYVTRDTMFTASGTEGESTDLSTVKLNLIDDITGDGVIDVLDCFMSERFIHSTTGSDDYTLKVADSNGDGTLDVNDYGAIVNSALK